MESVEIELAHIVKGSDVLQAVKHIANALMESRSGGAASTEILEIKSRSEKDTILHQIMLQPLCGLCVFFTNREASSDTLYQEIDENAFFSRICISYAKRHQGSPYTDHEETDVIKEIVDRLYTILNRQLPA